MLVELFNLYQRKARKRRAKIFNQLVQPTDNDTILDLGGNDGRYIASVIPYRKNVTIADISQKKLIVAEKKYGFKTLVLAEDGSIPKDPRHFDVIFSSSVIEHVTVDKNKAYQVKSNSEFKEKAFKRQKKFAEEIRLKSKSYFVQTPYKYFPIESHTWLPIFFIFFSREIQIKIIEFLSESKLWPKKVRWHDFNLLTISDMAKLFPDAIIVKEKSFGFTKSLMAVRISPEQKSKKLGDLTTSATTKNIK